MTNKFVGLGQFAMAIRSAPYSKDSHRSVGTFAGTSIASDGGYAVPVDFAREIFMRGEGSLVPLCQVIPAGSGQIEVPVDDTTPWSSEGIIASWDDEASVAAQRKPKLSLATHKLRKLRVLVPVSEELVADAPAFNAWLPQAMSRAVAWKMNDAIINGPGAARPLGMLRSDALIVVDKETSQTAATINDANIAAMLDRSLDAKNATWVANAGIYGRLSQLTGFDSATQRLAGLPIVLTDACPPLGSQGDLILATLGGYRLVTRGPAFYDSAHLWFDQDLHAFRLTVRVDGQPILAKPTTPPNAGQTRSHFVALAERA